MLTNEGGLWYFHIGDNADKKITIYRYYKITNKEENNVKYNMQK